MRKKAAFIGEDVKPENVKRISQRLVSGERLPCVIRETMEGRFLGSSGIKSGLLVVTNRRVIFHVPTLFGRFRSPVYPMDQITSVNYGRRVGGDRIELNVSGDQKIIKWIPRGEGKKAASIIRKMIAVPKGA